MSYFCRIFTKQNLKIEIEEFEKAIKELCGKIEIEKVENSEWKTLLLKDKDDIPICFIDRDLVLAESIGEEEIIAFIEEMDTALPKKNAEWVKKYLEETKVIYAFELLEGINLDEGYELFDEFRNVIFDKVGGIFQADREGFSNEEGFHIVWQFEDEVEGPWEMAIIDDKGKWHTFEMELSDKEQQKEFKEGKVPKKAKLIK